MRIVVGDDGKIAKIGTAADIDGPGIVRGGDSVSVLLLLVCELMLIALRGCVAVCVYVCVCVSCCNIYIYICM